MNELIGNISHVFSCSENKRFVNSADENNTEIVKIFWIMVKILFEGNYYIVKGNSKVFPETGDVIKLYNYNAKFNDTYNNYEINYDRLIQIELPNTKQEIIERIMCDKIKVSGCGTKFVSNFVDKHHTKVWNLTLRNTYCKKENKLIDSINKYLKNKNNNKTFYLKIQSVFDQFLGLNLSDMEMVKFKRYLADKKLEFSINILKDKLLDLSLILNNDKIIKMIEYFSIEKEIEKEILVILSLRKAQSNGHTCRNKKFFNESVIKSLTDKKYCEIYEQYIYLKDNYDTEMGIVEYLSIGISSLEISTTAIKKHLDNKLKLNPEQKKAIINFFLNKTSILTGGPGYGKTTCIKIIEDIANSNNLSMVVLAPTGKVAERISSDMGSKTYVSTIHRFIGKMKNIKKWRNLDKDIESESDIPKKIDLIVIDEFSMVSNNLFYEFLSLMEDDTFNLLLMGDINQLPSIEAGCLLQSLVQSSIIPLTVLTSAMRYEENSNLGKAIKLIKEGKLFLKNDKSLEFIESNDRTIKDNTLTILKTLLNNGSKFEDILILTPKNKIVNELTPEIRKIILGKKYKEKEYVVGDYVMFKKNIYDESREILVNELDKKLKIFNTEKSSLELYGEIIFNGTTGIITKKIGDYYHIKLSTSKTIHIHKDLTMLFDLNYAITIHKSQGSESKFVIFVLDEKQSCLMNKKLMYTAVSRAKDKCFIVAKEEIYNKGIEKKEWRTSNLNELLKDNMKKNEKENKLFEECSRRKIGYDGKGIPTFGHNDICYRSRAEARWSYILSIIFDECQYEPFELNGYIPDFIVSVPNMTNLLVEIKGQNDKENFEHFKQKIINSGWNRAFMICNNEPKIDEMFCEIGVIYFYKRIDNKRSLIKGTLVMSFEDDDYKLLIVTNKGNKYLYLDEKGESTKSHAEIKWNENDEIMWKAKISAINNMVQYKGVFTKESIPKMKNHIELFNNKK